MGFENKYVKLKSGDRITLRNGDVLSYDEYYKKITNSEDSRCKYDCLLNHKDRKELDIIEVKRPVEYKTIFSEEQRIEDEKVDVEDVIEKIIDLFENNEYKKGETIIINL